MLFCELVAQPCPSKLPFPLKIKEEIPPANANTNVWLNLGILATHNAPLDRFNHWVYDQFHRHYNGQPNTSLFTNNEDDYIMVFVITDGETHYGWIRLAPNFNTCSFDIDGTYLNPTPNEHVTVN